MEDIKCKLEPCPFCGSTDLDFDITRDDLEGHFVFCSNCGARGGDSYDDEGAVENWNKRQS
jgi:Lar family restriction alleviation protein